MDPGILRERLKSIVSRPGPPAAPANRAPSVVGERSAPVGLGGCWLERGAGRSFVVRRVVEPGERHGAQAVGMLAERLRAAAAAASILGAARARAPFLFFDLETTGLSGGAGTYAFLVGCGWFEEGAFVTEQHLLTDHPTEPAMLQAVASAVESAGALVTFNGKSFDAPLLETRYLFHRLESPCPRLPHIDLLHPARRFWGGTVEGGCSLATLEARLLGVRRVADVPGFEIPRRYFHFIRSGDASALAGVLEHNRLDLLSLAALTSRLFHLVEEGPDSARDAREAVALGRVYQQAALAERADRSFERALALSGDAASRLEALRALAVAARRQRRHPEAAAHWRALLAVPTCPPSLVREAIEALAIHHEHRERDLDAAKMLALRGLEIESAPGWGDATRHRLARIERKIVSVRRSLPASSTPLLPVYDSLTSEPRTSS